jgi:hypothetical protein
VFLPLTERQEPARTQWPLLERFQTARRTSFAELRRPDHQERIASVSLATLEVVVDFSVEPPAVPGEGADALLIEAALTLRVWAERGYLYGQSGGDLATNVQHRWWPESHAARYPARGLALLIVIDALAALHGVSIYCDQLDPETDQYVRGRLHRAL